MTSTALAAQTTVTIPCDRDNTLYEHFLGSFSNGLGDGLFVGVTAQGKLRRALLHFDIVGTVPAGARILAASLTVNVSQSGALQATPVTGHRVVQPWGEGTSLAISGGGGQGAPSTSGDATWLHALYPNTQWVQVGGDFVALPSFTMAMPISGLVTAPAAATSTTDVQAWLDHPSQNFGWLLKADENLVSARARRLDSRESLVSPPTLTIHYLLPGQSGAWGTGCPVGAAAFTTNFVGAPIGGTTMQIVSSNTPTNSIGATFFALALDPAGVLLAPMCAVHLPLSEPIFTGDVFTTRASGTALATLLVPSGFAGFQVVCQQAVFDGSPFGFALGNAAITVLQ